MLLVDFRATADTRIGATGGDADSLEAACIIASVLSEEIKSSFNSIGSNGVIKSGHD